MMNACFRWGIPTKMVFQIASGGAEKDMKRRIGLSKIAFKT